jgi:hypothetical protein
MTLLNPNHKPSVRLLAVALLALSLPIAAQAANAGKEIATAATHAGLAAKADTLAKVHLHLHHTINCLVGPKGKAFDPKAGNPCDGQGNGALNDLSSKSDHKKTVQNALALAETGVQMRSLKATKGVAEAIHNLLAKTK